jgi:hypothetical protein
MLVAEALAARFHAQALLDALPVIYLVVALDTFDYAVIVPLRRLNYLSSKAPQMLWAYVLLTVITLPHQDAVARARICTTAAAGATDASPRAAARASKHGFGSAWCAQHRQCTASTQAPAEKPPLQRGQLTRAQGPRRGNQCTASAVHGAHGISPQLTQWRPPHACGQAQAGPWWARAGPWWARASAERDDRRALLCDQAVATKAGP